MLNQNFIKTSGSLKWINIYRFLVRSLVSFLLGIWTSCVQSRGSRHLKRVNQKERKWKGKRCVDQRFRSNCFLLPRRGNAKTIYCFNSILKNFSDVWSLLKRKEEFTNGLWEILGADHSPKIWMDCIATLEIKWSQIWVLHGPIIAFILEDEEGWAFELFCFKFWGFLASTTSFLLETWCIFCINGNHSPLLWLWNRNKQSKVKEMRCQQLSELIL